MKILVFGGGGFIGSAVVDRLLRDGHVLRVFERPRIMPFRSFAKSEQVDWVVGDIMNRHDVEGAIRGMDAIVHLVSTTLPKTSNEDPIYDVQSNLVPTLQILNAMLANGVRKLIFVSSGGTVYGKPLYLPIDEQHPTEPLVSYGITKLAIEKYLQMYRHLHGIEAITLRVSNPYGERQRIETAQGAVGVFLHHALSGIPIEIWGDGTVKRDYVHVDDVADAFANALAYSGALNCFNISSGIGTSLVELLTLIERSVGKSLAIRYLPSRAFDVPINVLANGLARRELQWSPSISLRDGLARVIEQKRIERGS